MKNFSLAIFLNITLSTIKYKKIIFFILSLVFFLGYFGYGVSLTLSITFSLFFALTFFFISKKRQEKKKTKIKETKNIDELMIELNFLSKQSVYAMFTKAFTSLDKTVEKVSRGLNIKEDKTFIFFAFSFEGITKTDVLKAYNLLKKEYKCLIYTSFCSPETEKFIERFGGIIKLENN